jgi:hypothetical protein
VMSCGFATVEPMYANVKAIQETLWQRREGMQCMIKAELESSPPSPNGVRRIASSALQRRLAVCSFSRDHHRLHDLGLEAMRQRQDGTGCTLWR